VVERVRDLAPGFEPTHAVLVGPYGWDCRVDDDLPVLALAHCAPGPRSDVIQVEIKGLTGRREGELSLERPAPGLVVMSCADGEEEIRRAWIAGVGAGEAREAIGGVFAGFDEGLRDVGVSPHHITRTWFYLGDIDRTYGDLNALRNYYFDQWQLPALPASTGVGASLGGATIAGLVEATSVGGRNPARPVSTRLQCPPTNYGPRFIRANAWVMNGLEHLNVSGISSIDAAGISLGDTDGTVLVEFAMRSVAEILETAGGFRYDEFTNARAYATCEAADVVFDSYRDFADGLDECLELIGRICRPELTFEFEGMAIRPQTAGRSGDGG
jgi:enamine deaminase RidA (YjgF/YER057c/UK114 family)